MKKSLFTKTVVYGAVSNKFSPHFNKIFPKIMLEKNTYKTFISFSLDWFITHFYEFGERKYNTNHMLYENVQKTYQYSTRIY
jgi:hypothetical protein